MKKFILDPYREDDGFELVTDYVVRNFPPPGWKVELAFRVFPNGLVEIHVSDPMPPQDSAFSHYSPDAFRVFALKNNLKEDPDFPHEYGDNKKTALFVWTMVQLEHILWAATI